LGAKWRWDRRSPCDRHPAVGSRPRRLGERRHGRLQHERPDLGARRPERKSTLLATTGAPPVGLSIQGTRLVWGENVAGHGRIVSLDVS
jgi:hypothetical protein